VMRAHWSVRDRFPLAPGWKCGSPAAEELRVGDLADHGLGTHLEGMTKSAEPAHGLVAVDALGIDDPDAPEQLHRALGRQKRALGRRPLSDGEHSDDAVGPGWSDPAFSVLGTRSGSFDADGRRPIAEPEARASAP